MVGAENTIAETKCTTGETHVMIEVNTGTDKATPAPSCEALAAAYPASTLGAYWLGVPDKTPIEVQCSFVTTGTKVEGKRSELKGTKSNPAASCVELGSLYTRWGKDRTGVYYLKKGVAMCIFSGSFGGGAVEAPNGSSAANAAESCNSIGVKFGRKHNSGQHNVWVKPPRITNPFQVYCRFLQKYKGDMEGWSLYALTHISNGWPRNTELTDWALQGRNSVGSAAHALLHGVIALHVSGTMARRCTVGGARCKPAFKYSAHVCSGVVPLPVCG